LAHNLKMQQATSNTNWLRSGKFRLRSAGLVVAVLVVALSVSSLAWGDVVTADLYAIADASGQYWNDIAGTAYSSDFQSSYSYNDASVSLSYESYDDYWFRASLSATGLKPNFCYQVKLNGKPEAYWVEGGDDISNEALGYAGRWWRNEPNPGNADDSNYETYKDDPDYVYTGYLVYDFFVTDVDGNAEIEIVSDNSYHVVWKTSQRTAQANDGPVRDYNVDGTPVSIYGEWEPTRALPGELALRPGKYDVQFFLTEESFHDSGASWATVMGYDEAQFDIAPEPSTLILTMMGMTGLAGALRRKRCQR